LSFDTEYPGAALEAVTDLTTGDAAVGIVAAFRGEERPAKAGVLVPAVAGRTPTPVGAGIETAPVVNRGDVGRRALVYRAGRSAATAGATKPSAAKTAIPDANFFIVFLPSHSDRLSIPPVLDLDLANPDSLIPSRGRNRHP
jgi:hypothetical protein